MDLPSWIDKEAWEAYLEMRKSIKKPMKTERAIKLAIHKLEVLLKQGEDPTAVLDQSIFNSWQGLFPVKNDISQKGDDMKKRTVQEELTHALQNQKNKSLPSSSLSAGAIKLFYEIGIHWSILQRRAMNGEDIFNMPKIEDRKMASAGS